MKSRLPLAIDERVMFIMQAVKYRDRNFYAEDIETWLRDEIKAMIQSHEDMLIEDVFKNEIRY